MIVLYDKGGVRETRENDKTNVLFWTEMTGTRREAMARRMARPQAREFTQEAALSIYTVYTVLCCGFY